jgi:hypothetical protein
VEEEIFAFLGIGPRFSGLLTCNIISILSYSREVITKFKAAKILLWLMLYDPLLRECHCYGIEISVELYRYLSEEMRRSWKSIGQDVVSRPRCCDMTPESRNSEIRKDFGC